MPNSARRLALVLVLTLVATLTAAPALAGSPIYLVGKLGNTSVDLSVQSDFQALIDGDDNSWAGGLGVHVGRWAALQLEYHDLGSVSVAGTLCPPTAGIVCPAVVDVATVSSSALSLSFMPHLKITERLAVYAKLGVISWESDIDDLLIGSPFSTSVDGEEALLGAGLRVKLPGPVGVFAEYEQLGDLFETVAVGVTFGF